VIKKLEVLPQQHQQYLINKIPRRSYQVFSKMLMKEHNHLVQHDDLYKPENMILEEFNGSEPGGLPTTKALLFSVCDDVSAVSFFDAISLSTASIAALNRETRKRKKARVNIKTTCRIV
jgi:hypothetical protein